MARELDLQKHFVYALFLVLLFIGTGSANSEHKESHNGTERYKILTFDFERVELPYVICLWILIVGLAKIGKIQKIFFFYQTLFSKPNS